MHVEGDELTIGFCTKYPSYTAVRDLDAKTLLCSIILLLFHRLFVSLDIDVAALKICLHISVSAAI